VNVDDYFSVAVLNGRLREFLVSRCCPNRVQNGSVHTALFSTVPYSWILRADAPPVLGV
jgi:hypothetical protein